MGFAEGIYVTDYVLMINGEQRKVDVPAAMPLLWVLRDVLGMTGTKFGCGIGQCRACSVHVNGVSTPSCILPMSAATGQHITTIEGIGAQRLHALQQAWIDEDVAECGYCQPGQIMSAAALLAKNPVPSDTDIDQAMSGNICRCGTYNRIRRAIHRAADSPVSSNEKVSTCVKNHSPI